MSEELTKPGAYSNIPSDEYHDLPAVGSTTLKLALKSLAKFKAQVEGRIPYTRSSAMQIGEVAHSCILEKDMSGFVVGPDAAKNTKKWKEFAKEHEDKTCLKPAEYTTLKGMYEAFFNHPIASKIVDKGEPEVTLIDTVDGVRYKGRLDYMVDKGDSIVVVDYKTTESARAEDFSRSVYNYKYDFQAAHYVILAEKLLKKEVNGYFWVAQEKEAPYDLCVYRMDPSLLTATKEKVWGLYNKISKAMTEDKWPGYPAVIQDLDLPAWASYKED